MEILVLVKRVPATDSKIRIAADGRSIDPTGVEFVLNPYDEFAVEEALKIKEKTGGSVTVLTAGGQESQKELRTCLAMGADKAVLIETDASSLDAAALVEVLAPKVRELNPGLVLCGRQAVDADDAQVGPRLAAALGWACITDAVTLEIRDGTFEGSRDIEGGKEIVRGSLPAVITCNKGLNEPRYPNLKGIMMAKKKPLEVVEAAAAEAKEELLSLAPPPERPAPAILGEGPDAVPALIEKLKNEAKVL